jgi:SNF2 family DNA or RNA helicase
VHRIGQKRDVEIVRFIIDKSIETRMLELNTEKKNLSQNILNVNTDKDGTTKQKIEKLKYLMENY